MESSEIWGKVNNKGHCTILTSVNTNIMCPLKQFCRFMYCVRERARGRGRERDPLPQNPWGKMCFKIQNLTVKAAAPTHTHLGRVSSPSSSGEHRLVFLRDVWLGFRPHCAYREDVVTVTPHHHVQVAMLAQCIWLPLAWEPEHQGGRCLSSGFALIH